MLCTPFQFEAGVSGRDYQRLGLLFLILAHVEHIEGNCLRQTRAFTRQRRANRLDSVLVDISVP